MKTNVYSWRVTPALKAALQVEARRRNTAISALVEEAVRQSLSDAGQDSKDELEQARLHNELMGIVGILKGRNPARASSARLLVRDRLLSKHAATQSH